MVGRVIIAQEQINSITYQDKCKDVSEGFFIVAIYNNSKILERFIWKKV